MLQWPGKAATMTIRLAVAVTDSDWFTHLRVLPNLNEVNFWAPGAAPFKALTAGELFLFKLHAPRNFIVGGGVFAYANTLPCTLAWEALGRQMALLRWRRCVGGSLNIVELTPQIEATSQSGVGFLLSRSFSRNRTGYQFRRVGPQIS
jgi:hypothetical protein